MKIFNKEPKFIIAQCPKCGGSLELDTNYETAYCQNCGMQYIVQNVDKKKKPKRTNFEMIMDFVERERDLKRKDKIELDKEKTIREKQDQKNATIIAIICGIIVFVIIATLIILTSLGILE